MPVLYAESVPTAEECFLATVDRLAERDLLEITLVIYTSDHSEALGEAANAATLGHGDQITPDLVYVSVIFAGAGLPDVDLDALLSGIDVAPTALAALGRSGHRENGDTVNWHVDGQNCWTGTPGDRLLRSERWVTYDAIGLGELDRYRATSVWDADGGIVFQQGSRLARVGLAVGNEFGKPPWAYLTRDARRPDWWPTPPRWYAAWWLWYGNPGFTADEAGAATEPFRESPVTDTAATGVDREQLRKLGYLK